MDIPPPDPTKMLEKWMEWERGEVQPGKLVSDLKNAGLPDLLRTMVASAASDGA